MSKRKINFRRLLIPLQKDLGLVLPNLLSVLWRRVNLYSKLLNTFAFQCAQKKSRISEGIRTVWTLLMPVKNFQGITLLQPY